MGAQLLAWLDGTIDVRVQIAVDPGPETGLWGITNWGESLWGGAVPGWVDVSEFALEVVIDRGRERYGSRYQPGRLTATLSNEDGRFTPDAGANPYGLKFRAGRLIRVVAVPNLENPGAVFPLFTGRVEDNNDEMSDGGSVIVCKVRAFDALADLGKINPPATTATGVQRSDERVAAALDYAGWPIEARVIQEGRHRVQSSQLAQTTLEEAARAADAEGGELFADERNRIVFRERDWLLGGDPVISMDLYETATLSRSPAAYWRFSGAAATADESGNGHHLSWNGSPATEQAGVTDDDESILLDGTNDYATVTDESDLHLDDDLTLETWVKPGGDFGYLIWCGDPTSAEEEVLYALSHSGSNGFQFWPGLVGVFPVTVSPPLDDGEWHHLVVSVDRRLTTRRVRSYVDGVEFLDDEFDITPVASPVLNIGRRLFDLGPDGFFDGSVSELVIYDRVLSSLEVAAQYGAHLAGGDENPRSTTVQGHVGYLAEQEAGVPYSRVDAVATSYELARVENDVRLARVGGTEQRVQDAVSRQELGHRTYPRFDLINNSDADVAFLAARRLAANKDLRRRVESVTLVANEDTANEDLNRLFWAVRFGDLLEVLVATLHGWSSVFETHVSGIRHRITGDDWTVTYRLDDSLVEVYQSISIGPGED